VKIISGEAVHRELYTFGTSEATVALSNIEAQTIEQEARDNADHHKVLMRLYQTNKAQMKPEVRTGEKAIIEAVDWKPRPVIYASDLAGQRIKSEIMESSGNPYARGFVVDVNVETVNRKPAAYRILHVHDVVDLEDME
jgi:hypothetical protein